MKETDTGNQNASALQRQKHKQATRVPKWRAWWPTVAAVLILLAAAGGGIWAILWFSAAFTDTAVAVNFIVVNILSLFVLLAIIAQACIYLGQRGVMRKQWTVMLDGLDRTDDMIATMQGQLSAVEQQGEYMLSQSKASWNQADAAAVQARILAESVAETRKLVAQNESMVKAMQGQLDAIKGQEAIMEGQLAQMKIQSAASEAQFETAAIGIEAAEKSSIYANRAYVTASIDGMSGFRFHLRIENSGNSPANDVRISYAYGLREKPPIEEGEDGQNVWDIGYTEGERLGLIAARSSIPILTPDSPQLTSAEVQPWKMSKIKFYCWGVIGYEDMFNEKRTTWFCFYQSQGHPNGYPNEHGNQAI